jgi:hypothetical protein
MNIMNQSIVTAMRGAGYIGVPLVGTASNQHRQVREDVWRGRDYCEELILYPIECGAWRERWFGCKCEVTAPVDEYIQSNFAWLLQKPNLRNYYKPKRFWENWPCLLSLIK